MRFLHNISRDNFADQFLKVFFFFFLLNIPQTVTSRIQLLNGTSVEHPDTYNKGKMTHFSCPINLVCLSISTISCTGGGFSSLDTKKTN